ncbi:MAG: NifB/NifX family molybdenum-iron cluster-binding protein [Dehalococcoidales bacterium]|nr:NifB/NifX family molybdenum-iron cluster-binding protein [Dehalococcoidales bacterium]
MKIAVSSAGEGIEAAVDQRFGRCAYFVIVDSETMESESMQNSGVMASGGAGSSAGQNIAKAGVEVVLTGNCGPNAFNVLDAAGIKVVTGVSGTVKEVVEKYTKGEYTEDSSPSVSDHHGMGGRRR